MLYRHIYHIQSIEVRLLTRIAGAPHIQLQSHIHTPYVTNKLKRVQLCFVLLQERKRERIITPICNLNNNINLDKTRMPPKKTQKVSADETSSTIIAEPVMDQLASIMNSLEAIATSMGELQIVSKKNTENIENLKKELLPVENKNENGDFIHFEPNGGSTPVGDAALCMESSQAVKLYDLPTFSGEAAEWPLFLASYNDTTKCLLNAAT